MQNLLKKRAKPRPSFRKALRRGQRDAVETRSAILGAAMHEFAEEGIAGARMEAIAAAAGVNKALLHYYFHDKERLYGEALDHVFATLSQRMTEVLDRDLPPQEKIMAYAAAHFDFIAASPIYPRMVQREMMRAGRHGSPHMRRIAERYLRPIFARVMVLLREGIERRQFRRVDPMHFVLSLIAMNVFYFSSAPMIAFVTGRNPLTPQHIAERRAAVLDVVATTLLLPHRAASKEFGSTRREAK
ncbi:MAG TPA: TetR family transcriptional regulator [Terriglobales bacterium]|jgi:TetR/AcrR family transcriptional regulator|nr:TetR family transcriptional regulator [Terriglobales bacterium]